ncbi:MAG TPA: DNA-binding protein YbiB [Usitatibacter sp.]|nr:DNA-binding protein YbiB [Usitatibacter sp.]
MAFDPRPYLKEIARGPHSTRHLGGEAARELFAAIFAGEVEDLALGAILAALRMKGETVEEIEGMMQALAPHMQPLRLPAGDARPLLVASYNGARKLPNLVPLLALLVARAGVPVLVHGAHQEASRVGSFEILERLGHPAVASLAEAERRLAQHRIAAVPLALLSAPLARLIDARGRMGVRNTAHTLAKLLLPRDTAPQAVWRLVSVTHPDFLERMRTYFVLEGGNGLVMRGVEGEPVVRLRAPQPIEAVHGGAVPVELRIEAGDADYALPSRDADATARWTAAVLEGRTPAPAALAAQAELVARHCAAALAEAVR